MESKIMVRVGIEQRLQVRIGIAAHQKCKITKLT